MRLRSFLIVPLALLALQVKDGASYEVRFRLCLRNVTVCQPNVDDCTCQCRVVETCTTNVSPPRTNRSVCVAALVQSGCPDQCGKFYFGCEKLSDRECQCSWVKGCANEQDFDTVVDCEAQLEHLRVVAKEKCPIPVLSQYHPRHVCSSRKQTFCEYKSDCESKRCCYSKRGCNPNPLQYTTSDSCREGLPDEYARDPCKAVQCRPGFVCTQTARLCRSGWCTRFQPPGKLNKLFCVLDPDYDPCSKRKCALGWKCKNSLTRLCASPPCAAISNCEIDVNYDPCKLNPCNPGQQCYAVNGSLCLHGACIQKAACITDLKAGKPRFVHNIANYYETVAGDNIAISCRVYANPKLDSFTWTYENGVAAKGQQIREPIGSSGEWINRLDIRNLTGANAGRYTCSAQNYLGKNQFTIQLVVHKSCPPCVYQDLSTALCRMDIVVLVRVAGILSNERARERNYWTEYKLNVSRIFHNAASPQLQIAASQIISVKGKVPLCECQKMKRGRRYIIGAKLNQITGELTLFPEGVIQKWNEARPSMNNAAADNTWKLAC